MELFTTPWWSALLAIILIDLVIIGLLISVPIVVFGSTLVLKLVERFPIIIKLGAAVLTFTAAKMIVSERLLKPVYGGPDALPSLAALHTAAEWATYALAVAGVLGAGWLATRRSKSGHSPHSKKLIAN